MGAVRAGTAMGAAASTAYRLGQETSGSASVGAGIAGIANSGAAAAKSKIGRSAGLASAAERGRRAALLAGAPSAPGAAEGVAAAAENGAPVWARQLRAQQSARHHRQATVQAIRDGERGGAAANPDIREREE